MKEMLVQFAQQKKGVYMYVQTRRWHNIASKHKGNACDGGQNKHP